ARRKHMNDGIDIGQCRPAPFGEPRDQELRRIERGTRERTKTRDQHADRPVAYRLRTHALATPSARAISSAATAGDRRPAESSASSCGSRARSARSDRNWLRNRSSKIDHIHLTCCSRRQAAISPVLVSLVLCSTTLSHSTPTPSPVSAE